MTKDLTKLSKEDLLQLLSGVPEEVIDEAMTNLVLPPDQKEQLSIELIHTMLCDKVTDCAFIMEMMMVNRWEQEDHLEWRELTKKVLEDYGLTSEIIYDHYDLILRLIRDMKERPVIFDLLRLIKDCDDRSKFLTDPAHVIKQIGG